MGNDQKGHSKETTPIVWKPVDSPGALAGNFSEIRIIIDTRRIMSDDEITRVGRCLGHAMHMTLGRDKSDGPIEGHHFYMYPCWTTVLVYRFDSSKARETDPDYGAAFDAARRIIVRGTPVRRTDKEGVGTKGTRMIQGIGRRHIEINVR